MKPESIISKMMSGLSTQYQMEASMISLVIILIGMTLIACYSIFFLNLNMFMRIMIGINSVAGFVFLSSFFITQFQQYKSFMSALEIQKEIFE